MFIQIKNLSKKYKDTLAVNNINFSIEKNKTLGLLGPNGCGKTTSIGMMLGLIKPTSGEILIDNKNIIPEIHAVRKKMKLFSNKIISGEWKGFTGKSITHIVNVGIGGSDLGPLMVTEALEFYKNHLTTFFISNVDGDHVNEVLKKCPIETTLFLIVSKSFNTQETITNAKTIKKWFLSNSSEVSLSKHFIAISSNTQKIKEYGLTKSK